jgi:hypothetical protein
MNIAKHDVDAVRRVKAHLIKQECQALIKQKKLLYAKWISENQLPPSEFFFIVVQHQRDVFVHHYTFEFLIQAKYRVCLHFTNEDSRNQFQVREIVNETNATKNLLPKEIYLKVLKAIKKNVIYAWKVTRSDESLIESTPIETIVKNILFSL